MKLTLKELVQNIPDWTDISSSTRWMNQGKKVLQTFDSSQLAQLDKKNILHLNWKQWCDISETNLGEEEENASTFGLYSSLIWRKFALATFLADHLSYFQASDQVNWDRLLFVMHAFPEGFRISWLKDPQGNWWPAGYTAWYPIDSRSFDLLLKTPETLKNRFFAPETSSSPEGPLLYLFNYSVAPALKKTIFSQELMTQYAADIASQKFRGLSCITVSEDGGRVARRFGMSKTGSMRFSCKNAYGAYEESIENVYAVQIAD